MPYIQLRLICFSGTIVQKKILLERIYSHHVPLLHFGTNSNQHIFQDIYSFSINENQKNLTEKSKNYIRFRLICHSPPPLPTHTPLIKFWQFFQTPPPPASITTSPSPATSLLGTKEYCLLVVLVSSLMALNM